MTLAWGGFPRPAAAAAFPAYLNYQGKLGDASGNPLTGTYSFRFKLYDRASGGSALFSEDVTGANALSVVNGVYSVQIGSYTSGGIGEGAFHNAETWLEVDVNLGSSLSGAETLSPRERLTSSPFSFRSYTSERLGTGVAIATFTGGGTLQVPYGVSAATGVFASSVAVPGGVFSVGGSSFAVGGGSAAVAYAFTAGSAVIGGGATRNFAINYLGQFTARVDNNTQQVVGVLGNRGMTAAGQGAALSYYLNTGGATGVESGRVAALAVDNYSASANQDADMAFSTVLNGVLSEVARLGSDGAAAFGYGAGRSTFTAGGTLLVPYGVAAATGSFTATGSTQFSIVTSSGIQILAGGVRWPDGSISTTAASGGGGAGSDPTKVSKTGDSMTGQLSIAGSSLTVRSGAASSPLLVSTSAVPGVAGLYVGPTNSVGVGTTSGANGTLIVRSTSTTSANPVINVQNNAGTTVFYVPVAGTVWIRSDGSNLAELKVGYTGSAPAGYYSTYAP